MFDYNYCYKPENYLELKNYLIKNFADYFYTYDELNDQIIFSNSFSYFLIYGVFINFFLKKNKFSHITKAVFVFDKANNTLVIKTKNTHSYIYLSLFLILANLIQHREFSNFDPIDFLETNLFFFIGFVILNYVLNNKFNKKVYEELKQFIVPQ